MKIYKNFISSLALLLLILPVVSLADVFIYEITNSYSSDSKPSNPAPWATITFEDTASDHVQLSISAPKTNGSQFISQLNFNFDPKNVELLNSLSITNTSGIVPDSIKDPSSNRFNAGPSHDFDFRIDFETSNKNKNRLIGGTSSFFDIVGKGLTASMFNFTNASGEGPFITTIHIQDFQGREDSFWASNGDVAVPEPSTYIVLATLLGMLWKGKSQKAKGKNAIAN